MTDRLEVGRVARSHGLRGEVIIAFVTDRLVERTAVGARLHIDGRDYVVASARPHQQHWIIQLEGVTDRNAADRLRGKLVHAEGLEDDDALFVHELIGGRVVDQHGRDHGSVVSVLANPASDLLELGDGRLVPLVFVRSSVDGVITVEVPRGLLDDETDAD